MKSPSEAADARRGPKGATIGEPTSDVEVRRRPTPSTRTVPGDNWRCVSRFSCLFSPQPHMPATHRGFSWLVSSDIVTAAPALHNERRSMCRLGCDRSGPRQCKAAGPPPINFPRVRNILSVPFGPEGARIRSSMAILEFKKELHRPLI